MHPTLCSCAGNVFGVQLYKNNARVLLSRILSIVNSDWLQHTRSVRITNILVDIVEVFFIKTSAEYIDISLWRFLILYFCFPAGYQIQVHGGSSSRIHQVTKSLSNSSTGEHIYVTKRELMRLFEENIKTDI